jgi:hypothetical protein
VVIVIVGFVLILIAAIRQIVAFFLLPARVSTVTTGGAGSNDLTQKVTTLYPEKRKTKINE